MPEVEEIEFSFALPADTIGKAQKKVRITADETARTALARRFDLIAIDSFIADVTIHRIADSALIQVSGSFSADIVQACVVSREPVAARIGATISERLGAQDDDGSEMVFGIDDEDPPLPLRGGSIELGELLAQYLAVSIDPYPRAGAPALHPAIESEDAHAARRGNGPFESLAVLKKNPT